jgi:hypothetical protein
MWRDDSKSTNTRVAIAERLVTEAASAGPQTALSGAQLSKKEAILTHFGRSVSELVVLLFKLLIQT